MTKPRVSRREFIKGGVGLTVLSALPYAPRAFAQAENDRIVAAAKGIGKTDVTGMIWSNYYIPMQPSMEDFRKLTGIGVGNIQDISIFDIPQRAMAEALSRSPQFDFFHVDGGMIPSLASAGLLEPLDPYMKKANFKIDAVGDYGNLFTYKGQTWGIPTDGNVHAQYQRKDLLEDPDAQKRYADKYGKPLAMPETWDDDFNIMKFFHNPEKGLFGSANLRNRANGVTWYLMYLYAHGGFPFADDMKPTLNTPAGNRALEIYLREKAVAHPESPGWGTPQMIPQIAGGRSVACQYWDGIIKLNENPKKSKTAGKWAYGTPPSANVGGKNIVRTISSPVGAILVNRYSPRKEAAAYLALWWGTAKSANQYVADNVNTFHDAWNKSNMTNPGVEAAYTPGGLKAVEQCLQVACPPIYITGYLEFQDQLSKHLSEAYVGQRKASEVLPNVEAEWAKIVKRIGTKKLQEELVSYKAAMPKIDRPKTS